MMTTPGNRLRNNGKDCCRVAPAVKAHACICEFRVPNGQRPGSAATVISSLRIVTKPIRGASADV
jgi:hypothetical protein